MARSTRKTRKTSKKGKVMSVRSPMAVKSFEKLLKNGPLTLVYINAKWCGACHQFTDKVWSPLSQLKNKSMNMASVDSEMIGKTSLANVPRKFFPTLLLVGKDGKAATFKDENGQATNAMPRKNTLLEDKEVFTNLVQEPVQSMSKNNIEPVVTTRLNMRNSPRRELNTPNSIENLGKSPIKSISNNDNPSLLSEQVNKPLSEPMGISTGPPDVAADLIASQSRLPTATANVIARETKGEYMRGGSMSGGKMLRAIRNRTASLKAMLRTRKRSTRKSRR